MVSVLNTAYFAKSNEAHQDLHKSQGELKQHILAYQELQQIRGKLEEDSPGGNVPCSHTDAYTKGGRLAGCVLGDALMAVPRVLIGCEAPLRVQAIRANDWCAASQGVWGSVNKLVLTFCKLAGMGTFGLLGLATSPIAMLAGVDWLNWTSSAANWGESLGATLGGCLVGASELARGVVGLVPYIVNFACEKTGEFLGESLGTFRDFAASTVAMSHRTVVLSDAEMAQNPV